MERVRLALRLEAEEAATLLVELQGVQPRVFH